MNKFQSMLSLGIVCFLFCALSSCFSNPSKSQEPRVFYTNDKEIKINHNELMMLRDRLDKENLNTANSTFSAYNLDYIKDYIVLNEFMLSSSCSGKAVTKILFVEKYDPDKHQHSKAGNYTPDMHDEIWFVSSCGIQRNYRVYDMKNSTLIGLYLFVIGE